MKYYKIADLNVCLDGVDYEYLDSGLSDYAVESFENPHISISLELDNSIDLDLPKPFAVKNGRHFYETDKNYGFYDYITEIKKVVSFMTSAYNNSEISYRFSDLTQIFGITPQVTAFNVFGHLFSSALRQYDGSVLHASTISYNGKAVTFTAPSGTGKSTHTGLWKKYYPETVIINDDMPAVRCVDDKFYAYGTPWAGKTSINSNVRVPLHAMVFIERATECSVSEISPTDAFFRMVREIPISVFKKQSDLQMDFFNKLFKTIPAYLLKCDISRDAVEVVKNKLF